MPDGQENFSLLSDDMVRPANLKNTTLEGLRGKAAAIVENPKFTRFITFLILLNAVTLGLEASRLLDDDTIYNRTILLIDHVIVAAFCVELILKMYAYRWSFWREGWNIFDFIIVAISVIPATEAFSVIRTLRVFRLLRLISVVPQMRRVVSALFHALPGMGSVVAVLLVIVYVAAILATQIFGAHPDPVIHELFGDLSNSMFTMFQLITMENWPDGVAKPTMAYFKWSWIFFIPFIIVTSFTVLNLFIGIIVDALSIVQEKDVEDENTKLRREIRELRKDIIHLNEAIAQFNPDKKKKK